ncbi:MAG: hypothetical protein JO061_21435, partial [Acidobacteriaceae bacterium]|nr:hypothetical protein [Acidobacteriaceae bacterium]
MCHVTELKEPSTDQMPHSIRPGGALEDQADTPSEQTITLAATFTAEPIRAALEFWTEKLGIPAQLRFAPYNQVFQYLLNLDASHVDSQASTQVILLRLEDWEGRQDRALNERIQGVERTAHEFAAVVSAAAQRTSASYLVCFCPPSRASVDRFGGEDTLQNIERSLAIQLEQCRQVQVITSSSLVELYPVAEYEDEYASQIAHIPYTPAFFAALATMIARRIYSACDTPRKVIAIDCDHTLWDGVCAEDGPTGVLVDSAHCILQNFLVEQYNAGMLLCLVSKNTEEDVAA